ncbi:MAG TPA: glycosyltransferase family 39 protein [Candidatus Aquilonibacter sp.]|nr:glycosyltransferase family 39 protein [Candidatus Aquilonibacter sp.]
MPMAELIQLLIHKLESGASSRVLRVVAVGLTVVALALLYDLRAYRNLATPEGMDAAQLARNLAEGKGYTTLCLRPFSLCLLQKHNEGKSADPARIKTAHPDLTNPPLYPVVLAGLMKVLPFHYAVNQASPFWGDSGNFSRYEPDFLIALINECFLLVVVVLTFFIARKLFDQGVAWLAATLTLGCELLWQFSVSGLPTMLLLVIFLGLILCLLRIEQTARESQSGPALLVWLAAAAGALVGAGALTRYAFAWMIIPVALFLILFSGQRRTLYLLAALGAFGVVFAPWVLRNFMMSGTPFGTASFAPVEGTFLFPNFQLERSLHPDLTNAFWPSLYFQKLLTNGRAILQDGLFKLGGWAGALFWAGLLLGFRGIAVRRMRYFLLMSLGVFILVQAVAQTQLSVESPEVNSENLLVLFTPLVLIYGTGFFFTFLEQMKLPLPELRYGVIALFAVLCCLPMIFELAWPVKASPQVYPPYSPPDIQRIAGWMKPDELMMSDVPWAVAWYGQRQCIWLTRNPGADYQAVDNYLKPISALYLTLETVDGKFVSSLLNGDDREWGDFIIQIVTRKQIPADFALRSQPTGTYTVTSGIFLTDWERWKVAQ